MLAFKWIFFPLRRLPRDVDSNMVEDSPEHDSSLAKPTYRTSNEEEEENDIDENSIDDNDSSAQPISSTPLPYSTSTRGETEAEMQSQERECGTDNRSK